MRSPEQVTWDFVQDWLSRAEENLLVARELMWRDRVSYDPVGYHAQQAAAKFLKTLLTRHQVPFPKTHSVRLLLELAERAVSGILDRLDEACALSFYGVEIRDPGQPPLNRDAGARAVELATQVQTAVRERLADYLNGGRPTAES